MKSSLAPENDASISQSGNDCKGRKTKTPLASGVSGEDL
jgi:hypothetical protein